MRRCNSLVSALILSSKRAIAFLALCLFVLNAPPLAAKEPPVPPGKGSSGDIMVALLGPGIDYRLPELQGHLARDGEGDLIAWDFSDSDIRPFEQNRCDASAHLPGCPSGTEVALRMARIAPSAHFIIVKEQPNDLQAFGHMMTFVANTPARIIVWLDADPKRPDWPILAQAVKRFQDRLFVVPLVDLAEGGNKLDAYLGVQSAKNVLLSVFANPSQAVGKNTKSIDLQVEYALSKDHDADRIRYTIGSIAAGLAARELSAAPKLTAADLKMRIITVRAGGPTSKPGRVSLDDLAKLLNP